MLSGRLLWKWYSLFVVIFAIYAFSSRQTSLAYQEAISLEHQVQLSSAAHNPRIRQGTASWYSRKSPGINKRTASNEIFNDRGMTCAMWGVPFNKSVKVTNLENGKSVILRVNDRGPHKRYVRKGRIIDITRAAFTKLGNTKKGLMQVSVEFL